jgi:hypothetical protein
VGDDIARAAAAERAPAKGDSRTPNFKKLTSTTGAAIHVNWTRSRTSLRATSLASSIFAVADAHGKMPSISVREPLDRIAGDADAASEDRNS